MSRKAEEFRRAWPVLLASTAGTGVGVAVLAFYSFGAFVGPLSTAFGWSRAEVTAAPLVFTIGSLVAGPVAGGLADRFGARPVALVSQLMLALALAALSLIRAQVWTLYGGYGLLALLGAGTSPVIWSRAITGWFRAGRGMALGVSQMGTGVCGALLPFYVSGLAIHFGWRAAYLGLAALPLVVGLPLALVAFHEPVDHGEDRDQPAPDGTEGDSDLAGALSTLSFWWMSASFFLAAFALGSVMVHALPLLASRGLKGGAAALVTGLLGVFATVGRLASGYALDLIRPTRVAATTFAIPALACALLLVSGHSLLLSALALGLAGLAAGAEGDISGYIVARSFGHRHYGAIYGVVYTAYGLGAGVGPALAGLSFDRTHGYDLALVVGIGTFLAASALAATIPPLKRSKGSVSANVPHG
jgi:MFS family permease